MFINIYLYSATPFRCLHKLPNAEELQHPSEVPLLPNPARAIQVQH